MKSFIGLQLKLTMSANGRKSVAIGSGSENHFWKVLVAQSPSLLSAFTVNYT